MDIYQCPECELRFRNAHELEQHLSLDHPEFRLERAEIDELIAESHRRRHNRIKSYRPEEDG